MTKKERIPIASDHAGFEMKQHLSAALAELGYEYADFAHPVAEKVEHGDVKRGVLLCGTGLGMSYAANRHQGVRAAVAWSPEIAALARKHNDANVLVLPARFVSEEDGVQILKTWLETEFEGGRHENRVKKIETESRGA